MTAIVVDAPPTAAPRSLMGRRSVDWLLLGGLSLLFWPVSWALTSFWGESGPPSIPALFILFTTNPHFIASYKLAYGRGPAFIVSRWPQLIAVPLAIIALVVWGFANRLEPVADLWLTWLIDDLLALVGAGMRISRAPNVGTLALVMLMWTTLFTIGWHFSKQIFGCMMVYARYDGLKIDLLTRRLALVHLLSLWLFGWLVINTKSGAEYLGDFAVPVLELPGFLATIAGVVTLSAGVGLLVALWRCVRRCGVRPSACFAVPLVAFWTWWIPGVSPPFFTSVMPAFHAVQYMPFIYRVESRRPGRTTLGMWLLFPAFLAVSWLTFVVPGYTDGYFHNTATFGGAYFVVASAAFFNIHHYFIDNVLWRFDNREVQDLLLK